MQICKVTMVGAADYSVYARKQYLEDLGEDYGWYGGYEGGKLVFLISYISKTRGPFNFVQLQSSVQHLAKMDKQSEQLFLDMLVDRLGMEYQFMVQPPGNVIFDQYPEGSIYANCGTMYIDLGLEEDVLWSNINNKERKKITKASSSIDIRMARLSDYKVEFCTYNRDLDKVETIAHIIHDEVWAHDFHRESINRITNGSVHLMYWEIIKYFKRLGCQYFDLASSRLSTVSGTKLDGVYQFKRSFGPLVKTGYLWKYAFNKPMYNLYKMLQLIKNGHHDIIDQERNR